MLLRICARGATHFTAIESAHVDAYIEQLQKSRALAKGARDGVVPKSTRIDASSPEPGIASALTPYRRAPFNDVTRVRGTPSFQLGMADELLAAW